MISSATKIHRWASATVAAVVCLTVLQFSTAQRARELTGGGSIVIPPPPRELRRSLERAKEAIQSAQFTEAVELLSAILSAGDSEDFFLADGTTTLKNEACRILGTLPRRGREFYELQVGHTARKALDEAVARRDLSRVDEISRRFFHTEAGYEATLLLAHQAVDNNLPTTAKIHLRRLREAPEAAKMYEPQLSFLLAVCHRLSGQYQQADTLIEEVTENYPNANVGIGGQLVNPADGLLAMLSSLDRVSHAPEPGRLAGERDWKLFRGTPDRNGAANGGMPLEKLEWEVHTAVFVSDETRIAREHDRLLQDQRAAIPAASPLAVGDYLVMNAARMVLGVGLRSGKRIWPYPWDVAESLPKESESGTNLLRRSRLSLSGPESELRNKVWLDLVHAQMSSDGNYVFLLRDTEPVRQPSALNVRTRLPLKHRPNRLVALELATEGKTIWALGGEEGDSPELEEAFFLGAPLPIDGQLYVVAELKDELKLLVLDAASGRLRWSQQLGQIEPPNQYVTRNGQRDRGGSCLAYSDGILICPTTTGAVIAVDTQLRWLSWKYDYRTTSVVGRTFRSRSVPGDAVGRQWADGAPIIAEGRVLITPTDSNELHCLDLLSGKLAWKLSRGNSLFVAGAWNGVAVVVGKHTVHGVHLQTGKTLWQSQEFPDEALVSGRGFYHEGSYYFPTTERQLIRLDVSDGQFVETLNTEYALGNLICHGDYVISQSHDAVRTFLLRDRIRSDVATKLKERPNDPVVLENHASLLLGDGLVDEALAVLRRAVSLPVEPSRLSSIRAKLASLLISRLQSDFANNESLIDEVREYLDNKRLQVDFQRAVAAGYQATDRPARALAEVLTLIDLRTAADADAMSEELIAASPGRQIHPTIWLSQLVGQLTAELSGTELAEANQLIEKHLRHAIQSGDRDQLKNWCRCVAEAAGTLEARYELAQQDISSGRALEAELTLAALQQRLVAATGIDRQTAAQAATRLSELMATYGENAAAIAVLRQVVDAAPQLVLSDGATAQQQLIELETDQPLPKYSAANWPRGRVKTDSAATNSNRRAANRSQTIPVRQTDGLWSESYRVEVDRQYLTVLDGFNRMRRRIGLRKSGASAFAQYAGWDAVARGHLIIVSNGAEVMAVDVLGDYENSEDRILWRHNTTESGRMPQPQSARLGQDENRLLPLHSQLGPTSSTGVALIERGDLLCLDLVTGKTLWKVADVGDNAAIFGDEDSVLVVTNNADHEADAYSMTDGSMLGAVRMPVKPMQWRPFGRLAIRWQTEQDEIQLSAFDTKIEAEVWRRSVAKDADIQFVGSEELAICQPDGTFEIIELLTGESRVVAEVEVGDQLRSVLVVKTPDQYVVGIGQKKIPTSTNSLLRASIGFDFSGYLYAFSRETGQPVWSAPTFVRDFLLCEYQAIDTPIIVFMRSYQVPKTQPHQRQKTVGEVACLDRRDGSIVYRSKQPTYQKNCLITANPEDATIVLNYQYRGSIQLTFTDEEGEADENPVNKLEPDDVQESENEQRPSEGTE